MKQTIITAQGERLITEGRGKRLIIRGLIIGGVIIAGLIITAAVIGFTRTPAPTPAPAPRNSDAQLVNSYNEGWDEALQDIREIAARPAHSHTNADGSKISDPNGMELLKECLSDSTLSLDELHACIDQPAN